MPLVTLSQKELHRLEAIQKIRGRRLSVVQAAELLHLSRSQVHRLRGRARAVEVEIKNRTSRSH